MTRALHLWNKAAVTVAGLGIASLGVAMILWRAGVLSAPASIDTASLMRVIESDWWPWAAGVAGLVVVLLGIRWFIAYVPRSARSELSLSPSNEQGDLSVSLAAVASAIDDRMALAPGVTRCTSHVRLDRGVRLIETRIHVDRGLPLGMLTTVVTDVARDVDAMLSGDAPAARVRLYVNRSRREMQLRVDSAASLLPQHRQ